MASNDIQADLEALANCLNNGDYESAGKLYQIVEKSIHPSLIHRIAYLKVSIGELGIDGELNKAQDFLNSGNCIDALASLGNLDKYISYLDFKSYFKEIEPVHKKTNAKVLQLFDKADKAFSLNKYDKAEGLLYRAKNSITDLIELYRIAYGKYFGTHLKIGTIKM